MSEKITAQHPDDNRSPILRTMAITALSNNEPFEVADYIKGNRIKPDWFLIATVEYKCVEKPIYKKPRESHDVFSFVDE